jgi:putative acetyltransferase
MTTRPTLDPYKNEPMTPTIRLETTADHEAIRHVNRLAFGQDDEAGIVDVLRNDGYARVSLVAEVSGKIAGHILFSDLPILTDSGTVSALSLAPMAVLPEYQKQGIGSALVQKGLEACRNQGYQIVVVLGHSHFYPRFGFSAKLAEPLSSPFFGRDTRVSPLVCMALPAHISGKSCSTTRLLPIMVGGNQSTGKSFLAGVVRPAAAPGTPVDSLSHASRRPANHPQPHGIPQQTRGMMSGSSAPSCLETPACASRLFPGK